VSLMPFFRYNPAYDSSASLRRHRIHTLKA
jgi:hypothetical protein